MGPRQKEGSCAAIHTGGRHPPGSAGGGVNAGLMKRSSFDDFFPLVERLDTAFFLVYGWKGTQGGATGGRASQRLGISVRAGLAVAWVVAQFRAS